MHSQLSSVENHNQSIIFCLEKNYIKTIVYLETNHVGNTTYGAVEWRGLYLVLCLTTQVKDMEILESYPCFPIFSGL